MKKLEKNYRALIKLLTIYGKTHMVALCEAWWQTCLDLGFDANAFKSGILVEVSLVLSYLVDDFRDHVLRGLGDTRRARQFTRNIKLMSNLLS